MPNKPWPMFGLLAAILAVTSPRAETEYASPPSESATAVEHFLNMPGFAPTPVPLPPGARVEPSERSRAEPFESQREKGRLDREGQNEEQLRAVSLEALFARLSIVESAEEAQSVAGSIARLWSRSGSETADLLRSRAATASKVGEPRLALELFDRIVALEPDWAEAYVGRAHARTGVGDVEGAVSDLQTAVKLEPRRFDALVALAALEEGAGAKARALEYYRRALAIIPQQEEWRKAEERLRLEVEGRDI